MRFLLLVAYIIAEIYLVAEFIDEMGFLAFILEIIISAILGFGILASQFGSINTSLRSIMEFRLSVGSFLGRSICRLIGGILLIIPAILSDIFGVTFFIISLLFKAQSQESSFFSDNVNNSTKHKSNEEIIDVEVVETDSKS